MTSPSSPNETMVYDPLQKQKGAAKTARIPIKVVPAEVLPKPDWIRVKAASASSRFLEIKKILREHQLYTVCEEASCPNIGECFGKGTATFMIMGESAGIAAAMALDTGVAVQDVDPARLRGALLDAGQILAWNGEGYGPRFFNRPYEAWWIKHTEEYR
jgi:hypothetical protein